MRVLSWVFIHHANKLSLLATEQAEITKGTIGSEAV